MDSTGPANVNQQVCPNLNIMLGGVAVWRSGRGPLIPDTISILRRQRVI